MRVVITYLHRGDDTYLNLIDMAFASAKAQGYETVLVGNIDAGDIKMNFPADREPLLMNWVLAAQHHYINSSLFDCDTVIFSPDALITQPLESIFALNFDMAFTNRDHKRWPINNGVIYLRPHRRQKIAAWWREAMQKCKEYDEETQNWFGDQQALHDLYVQGNHHRLGLQVALLPCSNFNASPASGEKLDTNLLKSAYIVHMKGKRKDMMQRYWDYLCQSKK